MNSLHVATLQTLATVRRSVTPPRSIFNKQASIMKPEVHTEHHNVKATCIRGSVMEIEFTPSGDTLLDVCSSCHSYYTGKQKTIDAGGRIEKFR